MKENARLEFKESVSNTFLKTVSAFANYGGGSILFGVDDNGAAVGLEDPAGECLNIENRINDSISPQPNYALKIHEADATVELKVYEGHAKPYLYRAKAYRRNDSATIEVDQLEMTRLVLEGRNLCYEQLPAERQELTFNTLGSEMKRHVGVQAFGEDALRTLGLLTSDGYNVAAEILADEGSMPGIDIAQFGESVSVIRRRVTSAGKSVFTELEEAMQVYRDCYVYEKTVGLQREEFERVPGEAFREALTNAVVHRSWDVRAHVRVAMFEDRIEVTSPGGLPSGLTEEEYLYDMVSVRRNPTLANVFYRLGLIEAYGTGVQKIRDAYAESISKPRFRVTREAVMVALPVIQEDLGLTRDQQTVYDLLSATRPMAIGELAGRVEFGRSKLGSVLKELVERGVAVSEGVGRGVKYRRA